MRPRLNPIRWADIRTQAVVVGEVLRTAEVFRVTSPMPCVWKCFFAIRATAPLNFPVGVRALFLLGAGSFTAEAPQDIAFNTTYFVEVPAQQLALVFRTDALAAADNIQFGGIAAPMTAWEGLRVEIER